MKVVAITKVVFTLVGIGLLVGAVFAYRGTTSFLATAQSATGEVIDLLRARSSDSTTYKPMVRFVTASGQPVEFVSSVGANPPSYARGETVEVLYTPEAPQDARIKSFFSLWGVATVLGGVGCVFGAIGGGLWLAGWLGGRKRAHLEAVGHPIQARLQGVERNTSVDVNGVHPYRVVSQWLNPETGEVHVFRSENLWYDPTPWLAREHITVLIAPGNPRQYLVDLSFLPKIAH